MTNLLMFHRRLLKLILPVQMKDLGFCWVELVQPLGRWPVALRASLRRVPTQQLSVQALRRPQGNGLEWRYLVRRRPQLLRKALFAVALLHRSLRLDYVNLRQYLGLR
jgi:hypothetical protein